MDKELCPGCGRPPPQEWCWDGRAICPLGIPARGGTAWPLDRQRLERIRQGLKGGMDLAIADNSLETAWILLGIHSAVLDMILSELMGDAVDPVPDV